MRPNEVVAFSATYGAWRGCASGGRRLGGPQPLHCADRSLGSRTLPDELRRAGERTTMLSASSRFGDAAV